MSDRYPTTIPDEDHVAAIMADTGMTESDAWFLLALERGEVDGDLVEVDPDDDRYGTDPELVYDDVYAEDGQPMPPQDLDDTITRFEATGPG